MPSVAVVADTTAYLPTEVAERHGITLVSLYVVFGSDRTERESDIKDFPSFFEELRSADSVPTTSQPSVGDFIAAYEPLLGDGRDVVSIHLSAGLSGTADAARQAAEQLMRDGKGGERVRVVDSATAAGGLGLLAIAATHAAAKGADVDTVAERVKAARSEYKMWFGLDTLEFLRRGGRIGAASAWIGSTLRVKPILTIERELAPVERVRTSGRMFERMVDYARQRHESGADAWVVQHCAAPDQAARLVDRCREIFGSEPVFVSELGPVLSAHSGPGMLGVGSIPTHYLQ
ncbi:MAG: DegV family protein [Actinomycetota bacterium]|nr:DegV family protein [Actinomycetota bacterium]